MSVFADVCTVMLQLQIVPVLFAPRNQVRLIEVGKAHYTAIEDNQVVLDASTDLAAAVPDGITDCQTLSELGEPVGVQQFLHRIQE